MNTQELEELVSQCTYKPNYRFIVEARYMQSYIQLECTDSIDSVTGEPCTWKGAKRYISGHMCRQEIIGICFDLCKAAEEHELREWFRYKGASIYNPHLDPDVLAEVAKKASSFNCRPNNESMNP